MFLLKGHEDLRQDERVMQFFSLVNSLLLDDPETFRRNLGRERRARWKTRISLSFTTNLGGNSIDKKIRLKNLPKILPKILPVFMAQEY